ncbi:MAG: DUF1570 domain-containing protein [Planctomycetota bacterium]
MSASLSEAERRLLELLEEGGAVAPEALATALASFHAARGQGDDVALGPWLVGQGLVSVTTVQELLAKDDVRPLAGAQELLAAAGARRTSDEGSAGERPAFERPSLERPAPERPAPERPALAPPEPVARRTRSGRARRRSSGAQRALGAERAEPADSRRARRPSRRESARSTGRRGASQRAASPREDRDDAVADEDGPTRRFDPELLAEASRRAGRRGEGDPQEVSAAPNPEGTRRFDPDALAAASAAPSPTRLQKPLLLPALAAGALCVVTLGGAYLLRGERPPAPAPSPSESVVLPPSPGETPPEDEGDLLGDQVERARALEAREDYAGALAVYRALPPAARAAEPELVARAEHRLEALGKFRERAERVLEEVEPLRANPTADLPLLDAVLTKLEALLEGAGAPQRATPAARRLRSALEELALARSAPPPAPSPAPARGEPAERVARFQAEARTGARRVEEARLAIEASRARARSRADAARDRAREASRRAPLSFTLNGMAVRDAVVRDLDERGFSLEVTGQGAPSYEWDRVIASDPDLALRVRALAVRPDQPDDQLELGRWCLAHRLWKQAQDAFNQALVLSQGRLKDRVPDVQAIARASLVFRGKVQRPAGGSVLSLAYDFRLAAHNVDWTPGGSASGGVGDGRYEVRGNNLAVAALKEIGWDGWLVLAAQVGPMAESSAALVGLTLSAGTEGEVTYLVGVDVRQKELLLLRRTRDARPKVIERRQLAVPERPQVLLDARDERIVVKVDGRPCFELTAPGEWGRTRVLLGAASKGKGSASFDSVSLVGRVRQAWIRKAFGEFDDHLRAFLARTDDLDVFERPREAAAPAPLSAEDDYGLQGVSAEARAEDRRGQVKLQLGGPLDLLAAARAFAKAAELSPRYAAARYRHGLVLDRLGQPALALAELERALALCPRFYEAKAAQARILAATGRGTEAEAAAGEALAIRPDHAPARSALALVYFRRGDLEAAREQLELALALDPGGEDVRAFRRNVINVLRGPPWERTYTAETEHYRVKTDISQARCQEYARELEAIRRSYQGFFAEDEAARARKATVLIFDTEEGFQSYAELTTDDRVESLLGCYLARYDQLLLYEDKDDATLEETRRVLYHEAFHQFIYPLIPELPYWVNEGLAEYFSSTRIADGRAVERGAALPARLRDLRRYAAQNKGTLPLRGLMRETPSEFYSGPVAVKYAQAWSLVHYFLHGAPEPDAARFRAYLRLLLAGAPPARAHQEAWKDVDWKALERAWWAHVKGL